MSARQQVPVYQVLPTALSDLITETALPLQIWTRSLSDGSVKLRREIIYTTTMTLYCFLVPCAF